jgi:hypothetical protein
MPFHQLPLAKRSLASLLLTLLPLFTTLIESIGHYLTTLVGQYLPSLFVGSLCLTTRTTLKASPLSACACLCNNINKHTYDNINKRAYAGTSDCFTHLRALLVLQAPRRWPYLASVADEQSRPSLVRDHTYA